MTTTYSRIKPLDFQSYLAHDDGTERRYELLETGELVDLPFENDINILLAMDLYEYLKQFVNRRLIRMNSTAIEVKPMTVNLLGGRTRRVRRMSRIPDLMVLSEQGAKQIKGKHTGLSLMQDNPQLVVEFVSESNSDEDYTDKRAQYEARGIPEYWILDRHQNVVTVLILQENRYTENCYQQDDIVDSAAFPQLSLTANQLLTEDDI